MVTPRVAVNIVTFNSDQDIAGCLKSVLLSPSRSIT